MNTGTHRPEILASPAGSLLLVVVEPSGTTGVGEVKHQLHTWSPSGSELAAPVPLTRTTSEYGEPADHRAVILDGKLIVIYQSLRWKDGSTPSGGGPSESRAKDQTLMFARFALDGTEEVRVPLAANVTNFEEDNFPDHCLLAKSGRLLVSTGVSGNKKLKIREVDSSGNVLATHETQVSDATVPQSIGNSLLDLGGGVSMLSSLGSPGDTSRGVSLSDFASDFGVAKLTAIGGSTLEEAFPTGNYSERGYLFVSYIARAKGGSMDLMANPYSPYLRVVDASRKEVVNMKVGDAGFAHVHPTMAKLGDSLFVSYSKAVGTNPQVQVLEYSLRFP